MQLTYYTYYQLQCMCLVNYYPLCLANNGRGSIIGVNKGFKSFTFCTLLNKIPQLGHAELLP